jgi:cytoskeleton protein RodZ
LPVSAGPVPPTPMQAPDQPIARAEIAPSRLPVSAGPVPPTPMQAPDQPVARAENAPPLLPVSAAPVPPAPNPDNRRIVLRARAEAWMQVRDQAGQVLLERKLSPGQTWSVPNKPGLVFATGNAGGTELVVDGVVAPSLGGPGVVKRDLPLNPDMIKDGKLPAQIRAAQILVSQASSSSVSP